MNAIVRKVDRGELEHILSSFPQSLSLHLSLSRTNISFMLDETRCDSTTIRLGSDRSLEIELDSVFSMDGR